MIGARTKRATILGCGKRNHSRQLKPLMYGLPYLELLLTSEQGVVPKNKYGNVYLFTPQMLPLNTVHLNCTYMLR